MEKLDMAQKCSILRLQNLGSLGPEAWVLAGSAPGCACVLHRLRLFTYFCSPFCSLLPPAKEVCEGYVFTHVCLSTGGEYVSRYLPGQVHPPSRYTPEHVHPPAGTPPGQAHPPRQVPNRQVHPPLVRYTHRAGTPPGQVHHPDRYTTPWQVSPG